MGNFLFSLRARALLLVAFGSAVFVGTMGFHATAERRMRLEFVRDHLLDTAKLVAAQQNHVIEYTEQFLDSLIGDQTRRQTILSGDCQRTLAQRLHEEPRIANIFAALAAGQEPKMVWALFDQLASYIQMHFATEESLMDEQQLPSSAHHKAEHRRLIDDLFSLSINF